MDAAACFQICMPSSKFFACFIFFYFPNDKSLFHILTASLQVRFNHLYELVEGFLKKIDYFKLEET